MAKTTWSPCQSKWQSSIDDDNSALTAYALSFQRLIAHNVDTDKSIIGAFREKQPLLYKHFAVFIFYYYTACADARVSAAAAVNIYN